MPSVYERRRGRQSTEPPASIIYVSCGVRAVARGERLCAASGSAIMRGSRRLGHREAVAPVQRGGLRRHRSSRAVPRRGNPRRKEIPILASLRTGIRSVTARVPKSSPAARTDYLPHVAHFTVRRGRGIRRRMRNGSIPDRVRLTQTLRASPRSPVTSSHSADPSLRPSRNLGLPDRKDRASGFARSRALYSARPSLRRSGLGVRARAPTRGPLGRRPWRALPRPAGASSRR